MKQNKWLTKQDSVFCNWVVAFLSILCTNYTDVTRLTNSRLYEWGEQSE
jgi:hypothetical protein